MISGFGTERLGHLAIRLPVLTSILMLLATLFAATGIPKLGYSGDNIDILRDGSVEFENYDYLLSTFRDFNNDAIVLISSDKLNTLEGFEAFRDLHFDLQFNPAVESLLSPFSLASYDISAGGWQSTVPARFENDADLRRFLQRMKDTAPAFQSLVSPNRDSGVIVIYTKAEALEDANVRQTLESYRSVLADYHDDGFRVTIAGQPAIRADLVQSIINDMKLLAPMAALICALIAFLIFRNLISVFLCVFPAVLSVIWFLGVLGHAGISLNFLTTVLPVLLLVIVFADTLHFYLKWARIRAMDPDGNGFEILGKAVSIVGPACSLAMITTAAALLSLTLSDNFGLIELGTIGAVAMLLGFIAVIVALPLTLYWATRMGFTIRSNPADKLAVVTRPAIALLNHSRLIVAIGIGICAFGLVVHFNLDSRFHLIDYLATSSDVAKSESYIDERFSGTTPLFAIVKLDETIPMLDEQNKNIFYPAKALIDQVFPSTSSYSLDDFAREVAKGGGQISESDIDDLPEYMTSRFISKNRREILITIFSSASLTARQMSKKLDTLNKLLKQNNLETNVIITGFPILSSIVAPRLMDKLRISLLAAVFLSIFIIMLAARSIRLGLACLIPNLLPIISVEIILWLAGIPLDVSITVALTVAFGIAVDDSIHLLNQHMIGMQKNDANISVRTALQEVSPAMLSTTLILVIGLSITLLSELPIITIFAAVVTSTLVFAVLTNIFQMPSYLIMMGHIRQGSKGN
ncbi:MAG: MMPL family transporter [Hyphomicrobiales bacterium]|nr:MMPL family transporter [Hyphomicrobiales bacterium]